MTDWLIKYLTGWHIDTMTDWLITRVTEWNSDILNDWMIYQVTNWLMDWLRKIKYIVGFFDTMWASMQVD